MHERSVMAFGDLHLRFRAAEVLFDLARNLEIDTVITMGDEGGRGDPDEPKGNDAYKAYDRILHAYVAFRDERPGRTLICIYGDKTPGIPDALINQYVGYAPDRTRRGSLVYRSGNVVAAHMGAMIMREMGEMIEQYRGDAPLVIFHAHSHSMGVLPKFAWLKPDEFVDYLVQGQQRYLLENGHVYWVNPGANIFINNDGQRVANCAIYDPTQHVVTLKSIAYT